MKTMFAVVLCFCLMGCASAPVPVPSEASENLVSTHEPTQAEPSSDLCQDVDKVSVSSKSSSRAMASVEHWPH